MVGYGYSRCTVVSLLKSPGSSLGQSSPNSRLLATIVYALGLLVSSTQEDPMQISARSPPVFNLFLRDSTILSDMINALTSLYVSHLYRDLFKLTHPAGTSLTPSSKEGLT